MRKTALLVIVLFLAIGAASAQTPAKKWFKMRAYLNGLKIVPSDATNADEFARQYAANKEQWDKAFAYMKNTDLANLAPGKYPIAGTDLVAVITDNPTKDFEKTGWESHRKVIDLQYVIQGAEKISVMPVATAKVTVPYDEAKDVAHYEGEGTIYTAVPGTFYLFFPGDAHRPGIKADGFDKDKKLVIKIKYIQ